MRHEDEMHGIPIKTCGDPIIQDLDNARASLRAEYFPCRFRDAKVIALRTPQTKTAAQLEVAGTAA
jgi:hypothetical protein